MNKPNEEKDKEFSIKDMILIGDLIEKIKNVIVDQEIFLVIAELTINKNLTFDQLKEKIGDNKNKLSTILEKLIDYDLILKNGDLFTINLLNFQTLLDTTRKYGEQALLLRESRKAFLFLLKTVLDREINALLNLDNQDFEKLYTEGKEHNKYNYTSIQMVNKEIFTKYQSILNPIYEEFKKEIRNYDESTKYENLNPYFMYSGFFYIPELD